MRKDIPQSLWACVLLHRPKFHGPHLSPSGKDEPEFIETLDYIFLSQSKSGGGDGGGGGGDGVGAESDWRVVDVLPLPHRSEVRGPLPIATEPSDHLMVAATLELVRP